MSCVPGTEQASIASLLPHQWGRHKLGVSDRLRPPPGNLYRRQHIKGSGVLRRHACVASSARARALIPAPPLASAVFLGEVPNLSVPLGPRVEHLAVPISRRSCED